MNEGDEMALSAQWIDLLRFEREQKSLELAAAHKEARHESTAIPCAGDCGTRKD